MIVAFSTSSKVASVAIFSANGDVLWSGREEAPRAASGACLRLLDRGLKSLGSDLTAATLFLADLGPGSFTGVRVGVTLAKTFALASGVEAGGADAFDLVDAKSTVVLPSRRGEWFVRVPGKAPFRTAETNVSPATDLPDAERFGCLLDRIECVAAERLVPTYLIEPSISIPNKAYGANVAR